MFGCRTGYKDVTWYPHEKNYLGTIVDEHYYRSNEYLLENADRYNYYYRPYQNGELVEDQVSKVFVGEYASSDKNTLAGAIAEAAVMTGFEKNSDVVRLAATAPLFNKVVTDGTYRWTPDAIWFDNESVWRTPNYYVQQMFAEYIRTKLLATGYETYENGKKTAGVPCGGVTVAAACGEAVLKKITVTDNVSGNILFEQDFSKPLSSRLLPLNLDITGCQVTEAGLTIPGTSSLRQGFYLNEPEWENYTVVLTVDKKEENREIFVGAGLQGVSENDFSMETLSLHKYCVGYGAHGTGLKVFKDGKEGYTMGDYSSSVFAGNLRACFDETVPVGGYDVTVDFGHDSGEQISCYYAGEDGLKKAVIDGKMEAYNRDVYHSVTKDESSVYMKLVNADNFEKRVKVSLSELEVGHQAALVTLTGNAELVHCPNVNTKEAELV